MSLQHKIGTLTTPVATGEVSYTDVGFQPQIVLFFAQDKPTTPGNTTTREGSLLAGAAVSSSQQCSYSCSHKGVSGGTHDSWHTITHCICTILAGTPSIRNQAAFVEMLSNGFKLNWTVVNAVTQWQIDYVAIAGLDNVAIKNFQGKATAGDQAYTGVGFQPTHLMFLSVGHTSAPPSNLAQTSRLMVGFADGSLKYHAHMASEELADNAIRSLGDDFSIHMRTPAASTWQSGNVASLDADGFTITFTARDPAPYYSAICFRYPNGIIIGVDTQKTSTGTKATTVGHASKLVLFFHAQNTILDTQSIDSARLGVGAIDGTSQFARWTGRKEEAGTSWDCSAVYSTSDNLASWTEDATPTVAAESQFSSRDANGFTLNWDPADATARYFAYMSFTDLGTHRIFITEMS